MVKVVGHFPFSLRNANPANGEKTNQINGFCRWRWRGSRRAGKFWHSELCQSPRRAGTAGTNGHRRPCWQPPAVSGTESRPSKLRLKRSSAQNDGQKSRGRAPTDISTVKNRSGRPPAGRSTVKMRVKVSLSPFRPSKPACGFPSGQNDRRNPRLATPAGVSTVNDRGGTPFPGSKPKKLGYFTQFSPKLPPCRPPAEKKAPAASQRTAVVGVDPIPALAAGSQRA